jgi:hypothetical protein
MREVRLTEPEKRLLEWKKLAEQRDRHAEEYIAKLKEQISSAPSRGKAMSSSSSSRDSFVRDGQESWAVREKKLEDEVDRLTQELVISSKNKNGTGSFGYGDEGAIRKLYEDLTGLVISKVEMLQDKEKSNARSYHAIFGSTGYYSECGRDSSTVRPL